MSSQARRFRLLQIEPSLGTDRHHVPPQHPDKVPRFLMKVDIRHHRAYHLLFGNAKNFEDAVRILKNDWWTPPAERID